MQAQDCLLVDYLVFWWMASYYGLVLPPIGNEGLWLYPLAVGVARLLVWLVLSFGAIKWRSRVEEACLAGWWPSLLSDVAAGSFRSWVEGCAVGHCYLFTSWVSCLFNPLLLSLKITFYGKGSFLIVEMPYHGALWCGFTFPSSIR